MSEAVIIGSGRSTPGWCSSRRRILRLRRASWRRTLAFTRKPPGCGRLRGMKYPDCPQKPGGFRASRPQHASNYAWLRANQVRRGSRRHQPGGPGLRGGPEVTWRSPRLYSSPPYRNFRHTKAIVETVTVQLGPDPTMILMANSSWSKGTGDYFFR